MLRVLTTMLELAIFVCATWGISFLSILSHEYGHALGYMLATGERRWHIRVGWGKRILNIRSLTVNLLVFDGLFTPIENRMKTKTHLITMLSGGPMASLILVMGALFLKYGGMTYQSAVITSDAIEFFINAALWVNSFILLSSIIPTHYFFGEVKGMETDGLKILRVLKSHKP